MIEATIGTVVLLLAALLAIQLILVFHGALAAHSAAVRAARAMALTHEYSEAKRVFKLQQSTALGALDWELIRCTPSTDGATCEVQVTVPSILPGSGLFLGQGASLTAIPLPPERGYYPNFERAN